MACSRTALLYFFRYPKKLIPSHTALLHWKCSTSPRWNGNTLLLNETGTNWASRSWGSSVSIVSGHGLDDQVIGVQFLTGAEEFSSGLCVQTCSGAHPASCSAGTGGPFPMGEAWLGMTLTTHSHLVPRSRMNRSYTSSLHKRIHGI
jgi:hypothetical protein